ncbi:MAG: NADH-ubiquinone oxidoreductase subunit NDUFA12 family protein [Alphaproteobacteria bacterium]
MANIITRAITTFFGELVGTDQFGNLYYQHKKQPSPHKRRRRWVVYSKDAKKMTSQDDASLVPSSHYNWLHHTSDEFPDDASLSKALSHSWQKPHRPNMTGTRHAYRPSGHLYKGGKRPKATGDYEAWQP